MFLPAASRRCLRRKRVPDSRGGSPQSDAEAQRSTDRRCDVRQHLPLRHFISASGKAIKSAAAAVRWTREDDIQHDYYHAICAQHLEAALDQDGRANAWLHRTVSPAIEATFQPDIVYGSGDELGQGVVDMPYDIPNVRCENGAVANHVRIGW